MSVYDVVIVGSGAGGGPMAAILAEAGKRVLVLERGPWFAESAFVKDEISVVRRPSLVPRTQDEPIVQETAGAAQVGGGTTQTGIFWNGHLVGGSSTLMSGFMMRMKPVDFRPLSTFGAVPDASVVDWPLDYSEMEPWYAAAEEQVGISGRVVPFPTHLGEPRSTAAYPQPPLDEHPFAQRVDATCRSMGLSPLPLPRAVLSAARATPGRNRDACDYNGYCGSYGCALGAKGSSLAAFLHRALATGRCEIRPGRRVVRLESDASGEVKRAHAMLDDGSMEVVEGRLFVVACQALETARLLLLSTGPRHPKGLANTSGQVGRNLLFSSFGAGWADFSITRDAALASSAPFVNRIVQDWYWYDPARPERRAGAEDGSPQSGMVKAGTLNFLPVHPNPILAGITQALHDERPHGVPLWGGPLKERLRWYFHDVRHLRFETFSDWLPHDGCWVRLSDSVRDRHGIPVVHVRARNHERSLAAVRYLVERGAEIVERMGARKVRLPESYGGPSTNLIAGTCRFGDDPSTSVLDRFCRAHDVPNLYVTDASFMPSGGSVPYTFTIYANALRVANHIAKNH